MNEKGMSLIEIVVCLSIMSIILTVVLRFVVIGLNTSTNQAKDANVQKEAQTTINQLKDWIMETNQGIKSCPATADYDEAIAIYQHEKEADVDGNHNFVQLVYYRKKDGMLYYDKVAITSTFTGSEGEIAAHGSKILSEKDRGDYVFARYVKEFTMDLTRQKDQKVVINVVYEDRGKNYEVRNVIRMRNVPKGNPAEFK